MKELLALPVEDRMQIVHTMWESILEAEGYDTSLSEDDLAMVQRRSRELEEGAVKGMPWEQVLAELRDKQLHNPSRA
jgi:putative addiction module component (TIGR02574 family)